MVLGHPKTQAALPPVSRNASDSAKEGCLYLYVYTRACVKAEEKVGKKKCTDLPTARVTGGEYDAHTRSCVSFDGHFCPRHRVVRVTDLTFEAGSSGRAQAERAPAVGLRSRASCLQK